MYHVFICYPRTYLQQVEPVHDSLEIALQNIYMRDAEVFQDKSDLVAGQEWEPTINEALETARVMLVVVVPTILYSEQCRREILNFQDTSGKFLVPFICEPINNLRTLAASINDHEEGSKGHEIARCAQALSAWEFFDFSNVVYNNPEETDYRRAIAKLARMITKTLNTADGAKTTAEISDNDTPQIATPTTDEEQTDPARQSDTDTASPRRKWLKPAALVAGVAILGGLGAYQAGLFSPKKPSMTLAQAQTFVAKTMISVDKDQGGETMDVDPSSGRITLSSPIGGASKINFQLLPEMTPLLTAGFTLGFDNASNAGAFCLSVNDQTGVLQGTPLRDGDSLTVALTAYPKGTRSVQKTCVDVQSAWRPVNARTMSLRKGFLYQEPDENAQRVKTIRDGEIVMGKFWTSPQANGWVKFSNDEGRITYLRRTNIMSLD